MNIETVSPGGWSPTKARLNRRRNKAEKLQLDLSAHIQGDAPLHESTTTSPLEDSFSNLDAAVQTLTPHQKELLDTIHDPSKTIKERVQAEVTLSKDSPDAAQIMKDAMYTGGRKTALDRRDRSSKEEQRLMEGLIKTEEARDKDEQTQFRKNKHDRQQEVRDRRAREYKAVRDATRGAADQRAKDAGALRSMATKTREKVKQNAEEKARRLAREEQERDDLKKELLRSESNDVIRTLKEARIDQQEIRS
jgi:hypothetical protein